MINMYNGKIFTDDRGSLRFINDFNFKDVKRFYQVENHEQNFIRAWHGHLREGKYAYVSRGSALIALIPMRVVEGQLPEIDPSGKIIHQVLSDKNPQIMHIPPGNYNGFKTLEKDTIIMFFSTLTMEDAKNDDFRLPYEDCAVLNVTYR